MENKVLNANIIVKGIISVLKKNNKEELLPEVINLLKREANLGEKVTIISPVTLNEDQKAKAQKFITNLIKEKFTTEFVTDESLIDGMQIRFKDKLWDLSLKKRINNLMEDIS